MGVLAETLLTGSITRGQGIWFNSDTWHRPCASRLAWHGFPLELRGALGMSSMGEFQAILNTFGQLGSVFPAL